MNGGVAVFRVFLIIQSIILKTLEEDAGDLAPVVDPEEDGAGLARCLSTCMRTLLRHP
jgi:hypothetical protein